MYEAIVERVAGQTVYLFQNSMPEFWQKARLGQYKHFPSFSLDAQFVGIRKPKPQDRVMIWLNDNLNVRKAQLITA